MLRFSSRSRCLSLGIIVTAAFIFGAPVRASERSGLSASAPEGFEALVSERDVMLDAYFGGRKIGEVRATLTPGLVEFTDPLALSRLIPDLSNAQEVASLLAGPLPANVSLSCGGFRREGCGILETESVGVIVDEDRFRVDIFVGSTLLSKPDPAAEIFLPPPDEEPTLVSLFGATLSGSTRTDEQWHFQNRTVASLGATRIRSDSSLATGSGLTFDNLTIERDRGDWRYTGGIFWAPGTDLVGRRKMVGLGAATQLDTRQNKEALQGTPLSIFLQQPAKVELLVDGRIVSSRIYPAGNQLVDTASLPNGSYDVVLVIQEDGRPSVRERRFFTKGSAMAPIGRPLFSVFAGFLSNSARGLTLESDTYFYEATAAIRVAPQLGLDAAVLGTQHKAIVEGGVTYHSRHAQVRVAALTSTSLDYGALLRVATTGKGPVSFSLDLRKIVTRDQKPFLPLTTTSGTFSEDPKSGFSDRGSYTQILSILGYRLGEANLRLMGTYRKNASDKANYNIGASAEWPVLRTARWDIILQADARRSDRDFASFVGARILLNRGNLSISSSAGFRHQSDKDGGENRVVGEVQAGWYRQLSDQMQLSGDAAIGRDADGSYARASAGAASGLISARADFLHQFGDLQTSQYAANISGGIALSRAGISLAGRQMNDTAIMVSVGGSNIAGSFDVLIDNVVRGKVSGGGQLVLFLEPYRTYDVRLRPNGTQIASLDMASKSVTLYPGNVSRLAWEVTPLYILFGRAVDSAGKPLADADIDAAHGISRTDAQGYFQIETRNGDRLRLSQASALNCIIDVGAAQPTDGLVSGGDLVCR